MDNHAYDLVKALTKRADSVWMCSQYVKDSAGCQQCLKFWKKIKGDDEKNLQELKKLINSHPQTPLVV